MILVDTSIWIDHLNRGGDQQLSDLLESGSVISHAYVLGEFAMGSMKRRRSHLTLIADLPVLPTASDLEVMTLVESVPLHGTGLSYIDAHLLTAARAAPESRPVRLWTRDAKLQKQAKRIGVAYQF